MQLITSGFYNQPVVINCITFYEVEQTVESLHSF